MRERCDNSDDIVRMLRGGNGMNGEQRIRLRFRFRRAAFALAAAAVGLFAMGESARAADVVVGSVIKLTGGAEIQRAGATFSANNGTRIELHDHVTTQPDSTVILGFPDGSSLALAGNSSIAIEEAAIVGGKTVLSRVTLLSGKIHAIVPDKTTGTPHSIEVDTPNTRTAPLH